MACNVASILSGDIKSLKTKVSEDIEDGDILSKIRKYTYDLSNTNCPDVVYDYFNKLSNGNLDAANKKVTEYMDIGQWMTKLANYVREKTGSDDSDDIVEQICLTMNGFYKTLIDMIEKAVSVVPEMFKRLDQLRKEIEQVILKFGLEIKDCILSVITAVQEKLNSLIKGLGLDFNKLLIFMEACPCAANAIGSLFGCAKNSSAVQVVACIHEAFDISPTGTMNAINRFFNNTLKATVSAVYTAFENTLKYVFKMVMTPIRWLVKKYCELLNYKMDISWLVNALGPAECFLIYTQENKVIANVPKSYSGMSVLDFIKTLKMWANCFDTVCSFSDDIALKIKDFNERLRLSPRFWMDTYTIDIFTACIAPAAGVVTNDANVREVFVTNQDSSKNTMVDLYDSVKHAKKNMVVVFMPYAPFGNTTAQVLSPDPESGTGISVSNDGTKKLYDGIDDRLIQLTHNIEGGLHETDSYFRVYQMLKLWVDGFSKSNKLMAAMTALENTQASTGTLSAANKAGVEVSTVSSVPHISYDPYNPDLEPTYKQSIDSGVKLFTTKPERSMAQSLVEYYGAWFAAN